MFSLESFHKRYQAETSELVINGRKFMIMLPKDLIEFINPHDVMHEFPLWAKIWPASWVLADYLAELPVAAEKNFLEIGGGVGLASIVAASFGHRITMTENNPDRPRQCAPQRMPSAGYPGSGLESTPADRPVGLYRCFRSFLQGRRRRGAYGIF